MIRLKTLFTTFYWSDCFSIKKFIFDTLIVLGIIWGFLEASLFFLDSDFSKYVKKLWYIYVGIGFLSALFRSIPTLKAKYKFSSTDVEIAYTVSDLFDLSGSYIIPFNSSANIKTEKEGGHISSSSLQGQVLEKFYSESSHFESDVQNEISGRGFSLPLEKGTTLNIANNGNRFYLTVLTNFNVQGNAISADFDDVQNCLNGIWQFISEAGEYGEIIIPVIGSGLGRVNKTRNELIKEIIKSFTASISETKFCEKLTICISPKDFLKHKVDLDEVDEFIKYNCKFTQMSKNIAPQLGTSI